MCGRLQVPGYILLFFGCDMPRTDISPARLHAYAARAAAFARERLVATMGRESEEEVECAFIEKSRVLQSKDVGEFRWSLDSVGMVACLRVDKVLYCKCPSPPRTVWTWLLATSLLQVLRRQSLSWMKEAGVEEVFVDSIAAPKPIDKLPAHDMFSVGGASSEYLLCAHIDGQRWLCAPSTRPFHPHRLVEVDIAAKRCTDELPPTKKPRENGSDCEKKQLDVEHLMTCTRRANGLDVEEKQLDLNHLIACAVWQAEQLRAAENGRAMNTACAEACLQKDAAMWPAGGAQFTVLLWRSRRGCQWQQHLTPLPLASLIKELNPNGL